MEDAKQLFHRPPSLVLHVPLIHMSHKTHLPAQARMEDAKQLFRRPPSLVLHMTLIHMSRNTHLPA